MNVDNIDGNQGGALSSRTSSRASAKSTRGAGDRSSVAPTYTWFPQPPSVSKNTHDDTQELESFNPNSMDHAKYTAMMTKLKLSLEDDRCRHAYVDLDEELDDFMHSRGRATLTSTSARMIGLTLIRTLTLMVVAGLQNRR